MRGLPHIILLGILAFLFTLTFCFGCSVDVNKMAACKAACSPNPVQSITYTNCNCVRDVRFSGNWLKDKLQN